MKNKLPFSFLALLLSFSAYINAQSFFDFADTSAQWNLLTKEVSGSTTRYSTATYHANGESPAGVQNYQRITGNGHDYYVRNDGTGKVYFRETGDTTEYLIYDFSATIGQTYQTFDPYISGPSNINYIYYTVVDTDVVNWGRPRKRMHLCVTKDKFGDNSCSSPLLECVEGIGEVNGNFLFPGIEYVFPAENTNSLLCFSENQNTVYQDTTYKTCTLDSVATGITEATIENNLRIFPNPVTDNQVQIQYDGHLPEGTTVQLFDITGRMVLQKQLTQQTSTLQVGELAKGLYMYSVIFSQQRLSSGKLVID